MGEIVEFASEGGAVFVEVQEPLPGYDRVSRASDLVVKAKVSFDEALAVIRPTAAAVIEASRGLVTPPQEIEVAFGLKFTASTGVIVASGSGEAALDVKLTWSRPGDDK